MRAKVGKARRVHPREGYDNVEMRKVKGCHYKRHTFPKAAFETFLPSRDLSETDSFWKKKQNCVPHLIMYCAIVKFQRVSMFPFWISNLKKIQKYQLLHTSYWSSNARISREGTTHERDTTNVILNLSWRTGPSLHFNFCLN